MHGKSFSTRFPESFLPSPVQPDNLPHSGNTAPDNLQNPLQSPETEYRNRPHLCLLFSPVFHTLGSALTDLPILLVLRRRSHLLYVPSCKNNFVCLSDKKSLPGESPDGKHTLSKPKNLLPPRFSSRGPSSPHQIL